MKYKKLTLLICFILSSVFLNAQDLKPKKYIIVVALDSEISNANLQQFAPVIYTGVGKVNATIKLYDAILKYKPDLVINYGTAGSIKDKSGLFFVNTFVQRDMDVRALGFKRGVTPFSNQKLPEEKGLILGTGDSFVTDTKKQLEGLSISLDLVDMEGYALNEVSKHLGVKFHSYKNVSDKANSEAANDWEKNAAIGAGLFKNVLIKKYGKSSLIK